MMGHLGRYGVTVLRLVLGVIYLFHGYLAVAVFTPAGTIALARTIGLPVPELMAWYVIVAHTIGGLLLILGLWTRWAALANAPIMLAAVLVRLPPGMFPKAAPGPGIHAQMIGHEFVLLMLGATVAQILLGGGALAATEDR
jgi:putative oxidoreductase